MTKQEEMEEILTDLINPPLEPSVKIVNCTIDNSRDYSSVALFEAAIPRDLTKEKKSWVLNLTSKIKSKLKV